MRKHKEALKRVIEDRQKAESRLFAIREALKNLESVAVTYPDVEQEAAIYRCGIKNLIQNIKIPPA